MKNILPLIFGISLMAVGVTQLFESLYGSGILMIFAGMVILILRAKLTALTGGKDGH